VKVQQDVVMPKQNKSVLAHCLTLLRQDKSVLQVFQEAERLFGAITKDIHIESKRWIFKPNTTSKEK